MPPPLTRDMDLIRDLLLKIEAGDRLFQTSSDDVMEALGGDPTGLSAGEAARLQNHLELLEDARFVEFKRMSDGLWFASRMTWQGHEFLDSARDPEVWKQAKAGASKAGIASVSFLWDLMKAYGRQLASDRLGLDLG